MDTVALFSLETKCGTFCIEAASTNFVGVLADEDWYFLTNDLYPSYSKAFHGDWGPIDAKMAVVEKRSGLPDWDRSPERARDELEKWGQRVAKKFLMKLLTDYLDADLGDMRTLVDYFEHRHRTILRRLKIRELFEELIVGGVLKSLPNMDRAPSECRSLISLAKEWGVPINGQS